MICIVFFIFLRQFAEGVVNPLGPTISFEYASCIKEVIDDNFEKPGLMFLGSMLNSNTTVVRIREDVLKYLHRKLMYTVRITSAIEDNEDCDDYNNTVCDEKQKLTIDLFSVILLSDYYILIVSSYTEFKNIINKMATLRTWNPRAYFLILCFKLMTTKDINIKRYPERMLTYLFNLNVINAILILPDYNNYRLGVVYGWKPFNPPSFCGYHNETADNRVTIENLCQNGILKTRKKLFMNAITNDETGCYLDIIALERQPFISNNPKDPNLEKVLIEEITKIVNLKTKYELINEFRGEKNSHGVWSGALTNILNGKGDILIGGLFPDNDVHEDFDSSSCYLADSYSWVVPRAHQSPPWVALVVIFQKTVWLTAAVTFFICTFVWKILAIVSEDTTYNKSIDHCLLNTWYTSLGFCAYMRPKRQSLRVFFVFLNIYCILFLTAYQTKLIDVLTHPLFEKQIETTDELINSELKFGGAEELQDLFENSTDSDDYKIGELWINVVDVEKALIDVVIHRNFSVLCSRMELHYLSATMPELSDDFGHPTYYQFKDDVFVVPLEIVTLQGFSFLNKLNYYLSIFEQCGAIERIRRMFNNLVLIRKANLLIDLGNVKTEHNALSLSHLEGGFLTLALGYIGGLIVLVFEIASKSIIFRKIIKKIKVYVSSYKNKN